MGEIKRGRSANTFVDDKLKVGTKLVLPIKDTIPGDDENGSIGVNASNNLFFKDRQGVVKEVKLNGVTIDDNQVSLLQTWSSQKIQATINQIAGSGEIVFDETNLIHKTGDETISGVKSFGLINANNLRVGIPLSDPTGQASAAIEISSTGLFIIGDLNTSTNKQPMARYDRSYFQFGDGGSYVQQIAMTSQGVIGGNSFLEMPNNKSGVIALVSDLATKVNTSLTIAGKPLTANITLVKGDVGLGNVDNTADLSKPVSTLQQTAINTAVANKVDKVTGKSLLADTEIARLLTLANVDISGKVDKVTGKSLLADTEITRLATLANVDITGKVDKVDGKSLLADTEITRLATLANPDLTPYIKRDGSIQMSGTLALANSKFALTGGGLDANNSDIVGLNNLYWADPCESTTEGIRFPVGTTGYSLSNQATWDSLRGYVGVLYWSGTGGANFVGPVTAPSFVGNATTASTAAALTTPRTINGVAFDGSLNITVADATKVPLAGGTMSGRLFAQYGTGTTNVDQVAVSSASGSISESSGFGMQQRVGIQYDGTYKGLKIYGIDNTKPIIFANDFNGGAGEFARFSGTGLLGLGTAAPTEKLEVVGNIKNSALAGTGTRMVVASATGILSTQAIPSGGSGGVSDSANYLNSYLTSTNKMYLGWNEVGATIKVDTTDYGNVWPISIGGGAVRLTTPRLINGVSFDGSADITAPDNSKLPLAGGQLTGNLGILTTPSLTRALVVGGDAVVTGIFIGGSFQAAGAGTPTAPAFSFDSDSNTGIYNSAANVLNIATNGISRVAFSSTAVTSTVNIVAPTFTGVASSATKLATPRLINGVAFDGTADITVVAGAGSYLPLAGGNLTGTTVANVIAVDPNILRIGMVAPASGAWNSGYAWLANATATTPLMTVAAHGDAGGVADYVNIGKLPTDGFFTVRSDGKVGIGTNAPTENLEVVGNLKTGGTVKALNGWLRGSTTGFVISDNSTAKKIVLRPVGDTLGSSDVTIVEGGILTTPNLVVSSGYMKLGANAVPTTTNTDIKMYINGNGAGASGRVAQLTQTLNSTSAAQVKVANDVGDFLVLQVSGADFAVANQANKKATISANGVDMSFCTDAEIDYNGTSRMRFLVGGYKPDNEFVSILPSKRMGINNLTPAETLDVVGNVKVAGTVSASGGFFDTSDMRLKTVVDQTFDVSNINAFAFTWRADTSANPKVHYGYSAQEVMDVMPGSVKIQPNGDLTLNYTEVLVAKVKMLEDRVKQLEERIN